MSFNIRVYGILITADHRVLVTDEKLQNRSFTKFPGGGLEFGEGFKECLQREFYEELCISVTVGDLFYLTEHFQPSFFAKKEQVISVYYTVSATAIERSKLKLNAVDAEETPRWLNLKDLDEADFMFPIDKIVVGKLIDKLP